MVSLWRWCRLGQKQPTLNAMRRPPTGKARTEHELSNMTTQAVLPLNLWLTAVDELAVTHCAGASTTPVGLPALSFLPLIRAIRAGWRPSQRTRMPTPSSILASRASFDACDARERSRRGGGRAYCGGGVRGDGGTGVASIISGLAQFVTVETAVPC